jgi:hypothetical protein
MSTEDVIAALDQALPDGVVLDELRTILHQHASSGATEVEVGGELIRIPLDVVISVVTKAFFKEYYDIGFSTGYRVEVAIGEVSVGQSGLRVGHCFATLFFNNQAQRFTIDFHARPR